PDRIRFDGHVDVGVAMAQDILRRLRFSNHDCQQILALIANHMRFADVQRMKPATLKRFVRLPGFDEHPALHKIDCLSSHGDLTTNNFPRGQMAPMPPETIRPMPLITGDDLIAAGYPPGPKFKEILCSVEDGQLEGTLRSKTEAMDFVRQQFSHDAAN